MKKTILLITTSLLVILATAMVLTVTAKEKKNQNTGTSETSDQPITLEIGAETVIMLQKTKAMLIEDGTLNADQPNITLEQAIEILNGLKEEDFDSDSTIETCFNKYAGAPNYTGGSGITDSIYVIDEERQIYLEVIGVGVYYSTPSERTLIYTYKDGIICTPWEK